MILFNGLLILRFRLFCVRDLILFTGFDIITSSELITLEYLAKDDLQCFCDSGVCIILCSFSVMKSFILWHFCDFN